MTRSPISSCGWCSDDSEDLSSGATMCRTGRARRKEAVPTAVVRLKFSSIVRHHRASFRIATGMFVRSKSPLDVRPGSGDDSGGANGSSSGSTRFSGSTSSSLYAVKTERKAVKV